MTAIYRPDKVIITAPRIFALVGMLREGEGGGWGSPLYKLLWYVRRQWVWFWRRFGLKKGIDFNHILVWILVTRSENGRMNFRRQV